MTTSAATDERIRALDSASAEMLVATATGEGDEALRAAAVRRLPDGPTLRQLAGFGPAAPTSTALLRPAQERLAQLLDPAALEQLVAAIGDPQQLAALVVGGGSTRVRQLAAQRIEDPDEADRLGRQVRDRDKSVYRILKAKSDLRRAEQQRQAQLESDIVGACVALERFSRHVYDALYVPSFEHFEARWRALEDKASPQLRERAQQAIDRCLEVMASHVHERMQQAEALADEAARRAALEAQAEAAAAAAREQAERAAEAERAAAAEREAAQRAREEQRAAAALAERQLGALIAKAHGALRAGHTGPAAGIRRAIDERLAGSPAPSPAIARRLQSLDARLSELKQWKDYAAAPKRAELITAMEALVGSTEPPARLAERVRELRAEWKTISKGIVVETQDDWERFDKAAEAAYQPCREYFEAQAKARAENVERRRGVLQRLLAFEAAQQVEHPDWRLVAQVLREAREEWRAHSPVERAANKPVEQDFNAALARLQARLDAWHAENAAAKQALIDRAQALLDAPGSHDPLAALKQLQQQWKQISPAAREQEQALWHAFRDRCDAVYQQRQQAVSAHAARLEGNLAQATALCAQAEQLAAQSGATLTAGMASIAQWRKDFESLGELPRPAQRAVRERFERALQRCQSALAAQRRREAGQAHENLLEAARLINAYAWALAQGASATDAEALKRAAEEFIAGVPQWPKPGAQALQAAWDRAGAAGTGAGDAGEEERRLRTLCIRAEIHADQPTPPEDQELRRQYQLQRLVQSMGRPQEHNPAELDELSLEWMRGAPIAAPTYELLLARFIACRRVASGIPAQPATSPAR
ncbi:MAG TPA: DUF349 domain-containing protein [Steroidobacteraceae bacterium]|nr:DUF349 domain-containing protein [Steroidobacteraceae bacterium]